MTYLLPVYPYHTNARAHWMQIEGDHTHDSYWSWLKKSYGARLRTQTQWQCDYWAFATEQERDWFVLRWS